MKSNQQHNSGVLTLLRICTFLLAAVSFWATAQGMKEYTFPDNWQAYAASLGIQGLLLGLNFSFFKFWDKCQTNFHKAVLLILTCVVLFCSSWFSYLYIAKQAYGQSWDTESRLLAQDAYRSELFAADTYLEQYGEEMEQSLTNQIVALYAQATEMDSDKVDIAGNLDWATERSIYTQDEFAAKDIMVSIIDAMEQATAENAAQDARQQSAEIIESMRAALQNAISSLDTQIADADASVTRAENSLISAQNRMNNAPAGTDLTPYQNAVNTAARAYDASITRQSELVKQHQDYQNALQRTAYYASVLGMSEEGVSSYFVGANLREIQRELFGTNPDSDRMMTLATEIFDRLQTAVDLDVDGSENNNYQTFLANMNQFVRYLENYRSIKELDSEIQGLTDALSNGTILSVNENNTNWKASWRKQFNDLKSRISGLPVYTMLGSNATLESFDRATSTRQLDNAIRNYLTEHNPAQQGLVYLYSPYRGIAIFSLFIAFLLDIAAFVTGFIIDKADEVDSDSKPENMERNYGVDIGMAHIPSRKEPNWDMNQTLNWNAIPPLNRYTFLTGDHQYLDGTMTYKAIENGKVTEIEYPDTKLQTGFYYWKDSSIYQVRPAELRYKGTPSGPEDGVYENAILRYEDQLLIIVQNTEGKHLGTVDPYTPVYCLSKDAYESFPAKEIQNTQGNRIVISLNQTGTRIIAIYIIKDDTI
ncbi:hypothetical protein D3Z55_17635 [Clostridiaceae bacterium]|mgnify:CR=1 FL=1|nr:hypothetical protein [Clostridiaceae bacterium]